MSDHFERLAERALGLAPTLRPLVAPLFAPFAYPPDDAAEEPVHGAPSPDAHAPPHREARHPAPPSVERGSTRTQPAPPRVSTDEPRAPHEMKVERHEVRTVVGGQTPVKEAAAHRVDPAQSQLSVTTGHEQARARTATPLAPAIVRRAAPREPAPVLRVDGRDTQGAADEPVVRVTIGRVEVRAVFGQPAERPPPQRPQPDQTLVEYLGGKRRRGR